MDGWKKQKLPGEKVKGPTSGVKGFVLKDYGISRAMVFNHFVLNGSPRGRGGRR